MALTGGHSSFLPWLLVAERLDSWVLKVSIAVPMVCIAGLGLWHLTAFLVRKLPRKPRTVRSSPEPPSRSRPPDLLPRGGALKEAASTRDSPERLQQACTDRENALAEAYRDLAESWIQNGQPRKAVAALNKILLICPESRHAVSARERLRQILDEFGDDHS